MNGCTVTEGTCLKWQRSWSRANQKPGTGDKPLKGVDHGAVKSQVAEVDPGHSRQASERPLRP